MTAFIPNGIEDFIWGLLHVFMINMVFYLSIAQEILTLLTRVTSVRLDIFNFMQEKYYARILFVHTKKTPH